MRVARALPRVALAAAVSILWGAGPSVSAASPDPGFDAIEATARLGEPVTFRSSLRSDVAPTRVEVLSRLPRSRGTSIQEAQVVQRGEGTYDASLQLEGHVTPNTAFLVRFRAVLPDGAEILGPERTITVTDERFQWRTLEGPRVRLHWYEGDEGFARRALDIGENAVERASTLLGVTETEPVDFFIYASEASFREALGPGTRENVGGQSNALIRTLFGLIEPNEIDSDWVDVLVTHELTHLVFDTAVRNPYHAPPRWLNEGLAVYLSEGYGAGDAGVVRDAVARGDLMPLEALSGLFPTTRDRFDLAYAESVSAVDHFIATYGERELVALIRSYADGVTDDEAFTAATGSDLAAFDAQWIASVGGAIPEPFGPRPPPPGPVPADWTVTAAEPSGPPSPASSGASSPGPPDTPAGSAGSVATPGASSGATPIQGAEGRRPDPAPLLMAGGLVAAGLIVIILMIAVRRRAE